MLFNNDGIYSTFWWLFSEEAYPWKYLNTLHIQRYWSLNVLTGKKSHFLSQVPLENRFRRTAWWEGLVLSRPEPAASPPFGDRVPPPRQSHSCINVLNSSNKLIHLMWIQFRGYCQTELNILVCKITERVYLKQFHFDWIHFLSLYLLRVLESSL